MKFKAVEFRPWPGDVQYYRCWLVSFPRHCLNRLVVVVLFSNGNGPLELEEMLRIANFRRRLCESLTTIMCVGVRCIRCIRELATYKYWIWFLIYENRNINFNNILTKKNISSSRKLYDLTAPTKSIASSISGRERNWNVQIKRVRQVMDWFICLKRFGLKPEQS